MSFCGISKLSKEERLTTAVILGTIFLMAELIGGIISNSLAVIADAAHLFTDVFGFVIALLAVKYARAEATSQFTFGFARVEVFSALFSIVLLWGVTIWLVVEAIQRGIDWSYGRAEEINGPLMFGVACFGIFVNICLGLVFHEDHSGGITSHCHHDHDHVDHEEEASVNFLHSKDSDGHPYVGLDHTNHEDHDHKHEHDHGHDGHSCSHHSSKKTSPRISPNKSASKDDHDHAHHDHGHEGHHECEHDHDHGHDHHNNDHDHDHGHDCDDDHEDHDHCHSHRDIEKGQLIPLQISKSNSSDRPSSGKNKVKQPSHSCSHDHGHDHHSHSAVKSTCSHDHHEQHHGHDHSHFHGHGEDVNMQAAFLHVLTDLLQSIGVAIGGAIIWAQPTWQIADVICTLLFSVLVLISSKPVATRIFLILFEASPKKVNTSQLRAKLLALDSVLDVHDLHVWNLSSTSILLTCHILASADSDEVCQRAHEVCDAAGIDHATIQVQRARGKGVFVEGTGCYSSSCRHDAPKFKCHRYNDGLSKDVQV